MKVFRVVGKVSLVKQHATLTGRRWVIAQPYGLNQALTDAESDAEEIVAIDDLGASPYGLVGIAEGAEAANPYLPQKKPVDAYVACLIDQLEVDAGLAHRLLGTTV